MGKCIYCGKDAGLFFKSHKSCEEKEAQQKEATEEAREQIIKLCEKAITNNEDYDVLDKSIKKLAAENDISPDSMTMKKLLIKAFENVINNAIEEKGFITDKEEDRIFNFVFTKYNLSHEELNRNKAIDRWTMGNIIGEISEGKIPSRAAVDNLGNLGVNLLPTESFVYMFHANYYEDKTRTKYEGSTQGISMRLVSGLWCRVGEYKGQPIQTTERVKVDKGVFVITTKHLYFKGETKSFRVPYSKIVAFYPFSDGIGICQDKANAKLQIFQTGEIWFVYNAVNLLSKRNLESSSSLTSKSREEPYTKTVSAVKGAESVTISLKCSSCNKYFPYKAEKLGDGENIQLNAVCPNCGATLRGTIEKRFYQCEYCSKKFESAEEVENHKKECEYRNK